MYIIIGRRYNSVIKPWSACVLAFSVSKSVDSHISSPNLQELH